ncbi:MAG: NAD(P)/FAD-dependent oxidoreductase [Dehalococcoidia bacterium]|nr:MAG: NAD(P)/FAD-dependent oxidoreductase [Dehalococcoidia bacterium]
MAVAGDKKRVVILGAGAAGLGVALELKKASAGTPALEVTLVDQRNYHHPLPFIWHVVSGSVEPGHISFPLHALLRRRSAEGPVKFRQSRVQSIDVEKKVVSTDAGKLKWDYLVVAMGSATNFFGMADVEENSLSFKSLKDAVDIHNRILDNYEAALLERNEERRRELLTFVVVGGGPTGIELAAAIQDFVRKALVRDYPSLMPQTRVLLVEAQDALLSGLGAKVSELAINRLRSRGIEVLLKTRISRAWSAGVQTADGQTIPTRTVIWVAGVKPVSVVESLPFEKAKGGRIVVNQYLEVPESPGVYVLGDCAYSLQENGSVPYPPTQQVAIRQGPACARNIVRAMRGQEQRPFRYKFKGQVIYMGRNLVVAQLGNRVFDGFAAALLRRVYYLWMFISYLGLPREFRRKLGAVCGWIPAYFYHRNTAHLE